MFFSGIIAIVVASSGIPVALAPITDLNFIFFILFNN
jgi:hypothetical protein